MASPLFCLVEVALVVARDRRLHKNTNREGERSQAENAERKETRNKEEGERWKRRGKRGRLGGVIRRAAGCWLEILGENFFNSLKKGEEELN